TACKKPAGATTVVRVPGSHREPPLWDLESGPRMDRVLTILLAGGKGTRLDPLTRERAKPAVPFGGAYRIVDFALSNCLNSRQLDILVLPQYKSLSLERHIGQGWARFFHPEFGHRLDVASPQQRVDDDWYLGTANAVYQNIYSLERSRADHTLVL